jgi:putative aminopeptidase FrvX
MNDDQKEFLFRLLDTPSPSGFERHGQRVWADFVRPFSNSVSTDSYGTTWATLTGAGGDDAPTLMIEAHADEIGFMVKFISDQGYLHITRIGGTDRATARGKRVQIFGSDGTVRGVVGNTAIHIRETKDEKTPEWHELFVDIGASSKKEVLARGIRVGHPGTFVDSVEQLSETRLIGRALDNRISGYIIAQVLRELSGSRPSATVHAVNAVQEEIGGHGAKMIAYRLHPSVAIVLDVTHATDSPGIDKPKHGDVPLGGGPTVTHGTANHPLVIQRLVEIAERENIPLQHESSSRSTGTDTDDIYTSRTGIPSGLISLPMRYMHSTVEMVDLRDIEHCIRLLVAFAHSVSSAEEFHQRL